MALIPSITEMFDSVIIKDEKYGYMETLFDFNILCLSLESELKTYEQMNRNKDKKKIELLREKLSR